MRRHFCPDGLRPQVRHVTKKLDRTLSVPVLQLAVPVIAAVVGIVFLAEAASVRLAIAAALILGIYPRYVALLLIPLVVGTIVTVHGKNGWLFSNKDGGWEYPAFWAAALLVLFLIGDGMWTLAPSPAWF